MKRAKVGIFGGSGFYKFLKEYEELDVQTPYGAPSASLKLSSIGSHAVAFLPRHGEHHQFPPHMVPYRANLSAFSQVGVERVIGPCAVGSLDPRRKPSTTGQRRRTSARRTPTARSCGRSLPRAPGGWASPSTLGGPWWSSRGLASRRGRRAGSSGRRDGT